MEIVAQWVLLARILRPQGRKGELLADLFTDFPERFGDHPKVWLAPAGFADRNDGGVPAPRHSEVAAHWLPVGRNAGRIVLHFAGVDSIEKAEQLAGMEVLIPLSERLPLEAGASYISDLVGSTVYDGDVALGVVEAVEFPTSADGSQRLEDAAALLAILSPDGKEILVPFASAFLVKVDVASKAIWMKLPEGLAEINQSGATQSTER